MFHIVPMQWALFFSQKKIPGPMDTDPGFIPDSVNDVPRSTEVLPKRLKGESFSTVFVYTVRFSDFPSFLATFPFHVLKQWCYIIQKGSVFLTEKNRVTAAGPSPLFTGFPIKRKKHLISGTLKKKRP